MWNGRTLVISFSLVVALASIGLANNYGESVLMPERLDDREVYIVTSKLAGKWPKVGPARHASIAICPKGAKPVVCRNGVPIGNCRECELYGTQMMERGFKKETKVRVQAKATKVCGVSASTVERRMRAHCDLNVPGLNDCRHHVIQVLQLRGRNGRLKPACTIK